MSFTWFEPEKLLAAAGWLTSGMIPRSRTSEADCARLDERTLQAKAARAACPDCNHSRYRVVDGKILDCHCAAKFSRPLPPISRETMGGA